MAAAGTRARVQPLEGDLPIVFVRVCECVLVGVLLCSLGVEPRLDLLKCWLCVVCLSLYSKKIKRVILCLVSIRWSIHASRCQSPVVTIAFECSMIGWMHRHTHGRVAMSYPFIMQ